MLFNILYGASFVLVAASMFLALICSLAANLTMNGWWFLGDLPFVGAAAFHYGLRYYRDSR